MAGLEASSARSRTRWGFLSPLALAQYSAIAWVQSRVFVNSFRTRRYRTPVRYRDG